MRRDICQECGWIGNLGELKRKPSRSIKGFYRLLTVKNIPYQCPLCNGMLIRKDFEDRQYGKVIS